MGFLLSRKTMLKMDNNKEENKDTILEVVKWNN
jgi:hypothetical protein